MAMEESKFWSLIAQARQENLLNEGQPDDMINELQLILEELSDEEVAAFQQQMLVQYCKAYDNQIIAAAFVIIGDSCDQDDQHGFRGWLISQGEEVFKKTLLDPDSLSEATISRKFLYMPDLIELGSEVYQASTGELPPAIPDFEIPSEPSGRELKLSELPTLLPNLCAEWGFEWEEETASEPVDLVAEVLAKVNSQVESAESELSKDEES